jgi:thymidylate synthase
MVILTIPIFICQCGLRDSPGWYTGGVPKVKPRSRVWHFQAAGANDYYAAVCRTLMEHGIETSPRGKLTKELHPTTVALDDPRMRIVTCHGRVLNIPFALAEVIQILTGQNDAQALSFYNRRIVGIQGDGPRGTPNWEKHVERFNAAYGERMRNFDGPGGGTDQLEHVIETLKRDSDSRQASIVLSHPYYDNFINNTVDRACNVYAHAMIRDDRLDWMQIIRSNDAVWGIPYNLFQWGHVMEYVARAVGVKVGHMFIVQDSFHVYEDKYKECEAVAEFDMYQHIGGVLPMWAGEHVLTILEREERNIRKKEMRLEPAAFEKLEEYIGPYWTHVLRALQSFALFKERKDDIAIRTLPDYNELKLPMLRMYARHRWCKDVVKYQDEILKAALVFANAGMPVQEADRWLEIG